MDIKEFNVVDKGIQYSKMMDFVEYVVSKSYADKGIYHAYLRDYYETVSVLVMFTDYDSDDYSFDEVMEIRNSPVWFEVLKAYDTKIQMFHYYIDCEIERINAPMANLGTAIGIAKDVLVKANVFMTALLENEDLQNMINAIDPEKVDGLMSLYNEIMDRSKEVDVDASIEELADSVNTVNTENNNLNEAEKATNIVDFSKSDNE